MSAFRYFVIYKPFGVLSQFTKEVPEHRTLGDLFEFPKDVYPVGRLDKDSEGLLILTNDKSLTDRLLNPKYKHSRTYLVQVEGSPKSNDLTLFEQGMTIKVNKKEYHTQPSKAEIIESPPTLPERVPPIRFRKSIPTAWLKIELTEGKNRQVRKMCAKIGFPTLRLVRSGIEDLQLNKMGIGDVIEIQENEIKKALKLL